MPFFYAEGKNVFEIAPPFPFFFPPPFSFFGKKFKREAEAKWLNYFVFSPPFFSFSCSPF